MAGDNNYSLGPVPNTARKGVASLTMVMLGAQHAIRPPKNTNAQSLRHHAKSL